MTSKMKVYIPIFTEINSNVELNADNERNPGIGGTQHVSLVLAFRLAKERPDINLVVVNNTLLQILNPPKNLFFALFNSFESFLRYLSTTQKDSKAIIPAYLLQSTRLADLLPIAYKTLCWFHHPFFYSPKLKRAKFLKYVNIGFYQHFSNKVFYNNSILIYNIFSRQNIQSKLSSYTPLQLSDNLQIVFLGSLSSHKGFHLIAEQWLSIKKEFPNICLHVIGYHTSKDQHSLIPTSVKYGNLLLKHIPIADIRNKKIVFHGKLGDKKLEIIQNSHFAILNPTGNSEAFPASPLECMALGTPVISSDDFGMYDSMHYCPPLVLRNPSQITYILKRAVLSQEKYNLLCQYSITIALHYVEKSLFSLYQWISILDSKEQDESYTIDNINVTERLPSTKMITLYFRSFKALLRVLLQKLTNDK